MSELPESVWKMIRDYIEIHGDPFAPYEAGTNLVCQETEHRCNGCGAVGMSKWPDWKVQLEHKPNCRWVAWNAAVHHEQGATNEP
jgi:hypothetical protein